MRAVVAALWIAATGCDYLTKSFETNPFSGDSYPIYIDDSSGAIMIGLDEPGGRRTAVLDVLSPITIIDRGIDVQPSIADIDLTVLGALAPGGLLDVPRAQFTEKKVVTLHPCRGIVCEVGSPIDPRPFDALLGIDAFGSDALRLRLASDEIFILPDIAGSEIHRSRSCDAALPAPFRGGGTLIIGGSEVAFANWRIAIDTCLVPNPDPLLVQRARGVDALLVMSTAIGVSMLNNSTYSRYREIDPTVPPVESLPGHTVFLPSGPVTGYLTDIPSIALVGNSSSNPRAPCRQVWAHHLLASRDCTAAETGGDCINDDDDNGNFRVNDGCPSVGPAELGDACLNNLDDDGDGVENDGCPVEDCPCVEGRFCGVPAIVELAPVGRIPVLIVPDSEPTLQALRTELRPDRPEVDGILGTDALEALELDIDRAHSRLLMRCVDRTVCGARGVLGDPQNRTFVNGCLGDMPGPFP